MIPNLYSTLPVILSLFLFCKGLQVNFGNTCAFPSASDSTHVLSIRAEVDTDFTCDEKRTKLVFTVPEERGKPCLWYVNNAEGNYTGWYNSCDFNRTYFAFGSYGNGTYNYTQLELFFEGEVTWNFSIAGKKYENEKCDIWLDTSIFDNCYLQPSAPLIPRTSSSIPATTHKSRSDKTFPVIYPIVVILIVLLILLTVIYVVYRFFQRQQIMKAKFYEIDFDQFIPTSIFVVFLDEHPTHKEVVLKFANYLKERFNFTIKLELYDRENIYKDPATWLEQSLTSSDVVLVIWSPAAEERWNNPEKFTDRLDLFTPVLKRIKQDMTLNSNLTKYIFACFEYHDSEVLPKPLQNGSVSLIKLMTEFRVFCSKLAEFSKSSKITQKPKLLIRRESIESMPAEAIALQTSITKMTELIHSEKA